MYMSLLLYKFPLFTSTPPPLGFARDMMSCLITHGSKKAMMPEIRMLRDRSRGVGGGGVGAATKREGGGGVKFHPYKRKGGGAKQFYGGHKKFWGSFYAVASSFSHTEGGGGGTQTVSDPQFSHFVAPPPSP